MNNETFELIDKATNGDNNAFQNLLLSVQDMIYNLSLRMLGSPHDAEDTAQEIDNLQYDSHKVSCSGNISTN